MRDVRYIDIPGHKTHELPPLLVHPAIELDPNESAQELESVLGEAESMLTSLDAAPEILEDRRFELALQLREQYRGLVQKWQWGDSVLEWIRQCEITFGNEAVLRNLLHPDVWPHAGRASFVTLLQEKDVPTRGVAIDQAVGMRLSYPQLPAISIFTGDFLFYLHSVVSGAAYQAWSRMLPGQEAFLPPERFHFDVVDLGVN